MIEMQAVTKVYEMGENRVLALNNASLRVDKGEFLAITGPSGSGKSTLLYTLGGLLTPTKGNVTVDGTPIYDLTHTERARFRRENIGFIFQEFELLPYLTAIENVTLPLYLSGVTPTEQEDAAEEALEKVGLGKRALHKPSELSGGEQQRVAIARGIVTKPRFLLADEPTGNLDQKTGNEILHLINDLHEEGKLATMIVTHDPGIAKRSSRVVEMIDGAINSK